MTCKDCIHYEACKDIYYPMSTYDEEAKAFDESNSCDGCPFYSDASRFIELPCKVGDTVFAIRDYKGIKKVQQTIVSEMFFAKDMRLIIVAKYVSRGKWMETIFPSFEEAENALKERSDNG